MMHQGYLLIHQNIIWQPLSRPSSQKANDANNTNYFVNRTRIQPTQIVLQPDASAEPSENKGPESLLTLRPNPASTFVELLIRDMPELRNDLRIEVFNVDGKRVYESIGAASGNLRIGTQDWKQGVYLVLLRDPQRILARHKLVINN
jgi:hypothetical protein